MPNLQLIQVVQQSATLLGRFRSAIERACVDILMATPRVPANVTWAKRVMFTIGPGQDRCQSYAECVLRFALHDSTALRAAIDLDPSGNTLADVDLQAVVSVYVQKLIQADF